MIFASSVLGKAEAFNEGMLPLLTEEERWNFDRRLIRAQALDIYGAEDGI